MSQSTHWVNNPPRHRTTTSFLKRVRTAPPDPSSLTQQTVTVYKLDWDVLKSWLEKRFPRDKYPQDKYPDLVFEKQPRKVGKIQYHMQLVLISVLTVVLVARHR